MFKRRYTRLQLTDVALDVQRECRNDEQTRVLRGDEDGALAGVSDRDHVAVELVVAAEERELKADHNLIKGQISNLYRVPLRASFIYMNSSI